ncbi:MAG: YceD family protein [Candidatus Accumulibacter sp.]|nr:YceD family protein [Accumulibacter sp.]
MTRSLSRRITIDSVTFAREGGLLQGELPVASLSRVLDTLTDAAGDLAYRVRGRMGPRDRPRLVVEVDGVLSVCCQRCLEGIDHPVRIRSLLELIGDEEELTREEIEDDSMDFLTAQKELDVVALIEDEIILDLPVAPRHENCALPDAGERLREISPFAALKGKVK